ncbi:DUF7507 domain-containing protein, partial [Psychrilyobacter atlanticus]|uniref:DUF7507 domain-containing protein n=1 Tax=Psychrilyobacter atlanticus TaxID=271091 RepID=UPI0005601A11
MKKIVLLFLLVISMSLWGKEVNGNYSNFLYYEDAVKSGSEVRITPDEGYKVGAVWSRNMFDLNEDFHFEYEIYLGNRKTMSLKDYETQYPNRSTDSSYVDVNGNIDIGADGMAFAFKSSDYKDMNYARNGQNIGYGGRNDLGGKFEKSFGVKFDTYTNPNYDPQCPSDIMGDLIKDHIAFIAEGEIGTTRNSGIKGGTSYKEIDEMEDGEWHKVTFDWDASSKTFKYTFRDGIKTYTDTYFGDIVGEYLGGRYVYFGFTSSTGQWMNEHKFRNPIVRGTIPTNDYKLDIKKEVVSGNNYKLGDTVKYKITITNTGGETLTNIKLKDGIDISDNAGESDIGLVQSTWDELKAGQSVVTYGTKTVLDSSIEGSITQGDIDKGSIVRTAAVEATKKGSDPKEYLYAAAEATVYANIVEGLEVTKRIDHIKDGEDYTKTKENYTKAGDIIVYKFSITNTGTQTLKDVSISDLKVPGVQLDKTILLPPKQGEEDGEIAIGTGEYIVTQDDVDNGKVINTANFRAVKPDGNVIGKSATAIATGIPATYKFKVSNTPTITDKDDKSVVTEYSKVGDVVTYTVTLENTGTGTLKDIKITDKDNTGGIKLIDPTKTVLLPGEKAVAEVTHTVTQDDLNAGTIVYPATFNANTIDSKVLTPITEPATVKGLSIINLLVEKTVTDANTNDVAEADEKLTYAIKVTNNSSVKVVGAVLTDLLDSKFFDGQTATNLVGATGNIKTGVTLPEIEAGKSVTVSFELKAIYPLNTVPGETIDNMATVSYGGTTKDSNITKTAIESATAKTNLLVEKTVTDANTNDIAEADEKLTYAIKVTNNSSVKVVGAVLTDLLDSKFFDGQTAPNLVGATGNIKTGVTLPEIEAGKSVTV